VVEVKLVGLVRHQEVPARYNVRHRRCVILNLEVGRAAMSLLEREAVPRDHQPPHIWFPAGIGIPLLRRRRRTRQHPIPLENQVLVRIAGQVGSGQNSVIRIPPAVPARRQRSRMVVAIRRINKGYVFLRFKLWGEGVGAGCPRSQGPGMKAEPPFLLAIDMSFWIPYHEI